MVSCCFPSIHEQFFILFFSPLPGQTERAVGCFAYSTLATQYYRRETLVATCRRCKKTYIQGGMESTMMPTLPSRVYVDSHAWTRPYVSTTHCIPRSSRAAGSVSVVAAVSPPSTPSHGTPENVCVLVSKCPVCAWPSPPTAESPKEWRKKANFCYILLPRRCGFSVLRVPIHHVSLS
jgi:hypothetical protein